jgi:acetolactate synthase I/II/III large subunit
MEMKVADVIVKCLEAEGIEYAFGISGSHYLAFYKALKKSSIKYISVKHESAAGFMAAHYARLAQKPALVLGTAGPGAMNLLNGITELYKANLPCFILTPIVATDLQGKNAFQEDSGIGNSYSIADVMKPITKKSITCVHPANIALYVQDLLRCMLHGRKGPVHLLIASNFFETAVEHVPVSAQHYRNVNDERIEPSKLKNIAQIFHNSKRPLLFVGNRAWYPDASAEIKKISNTFGVPVILSGAAKGLFDEYSPYFGGIFDLYGHRSAEVFVKKADLIISIGEEFSELATNKYEPGLFDGKLVHIDIDGYDIGRNYAVKLSACGDLKASLEYLYNELEKLGGKKFFDHSFSQQFTKENEALWQDMEDNAVPPKSPRIFKEISDLLPKNSTVFNDMGANGFLSLRHLRVLAHGYSACMCGYSMGQGVAGCIGGKLAAPDKMAISITGDGSFLMNGMEIATACQYTIPIIWIILVDRSYGMVELSQKLFYNDLDFCTKIFMPDLSKLADSFSIDYYKADDVASLRRNLSCAINNYSADNKSSIVEVILNSDDIFPIKPRTVKYIQDMGNVEESGKSPYLMKAFKRMLREKV